MVTIVQIDRILLFRCISLRRVLITVVLGNWRVMIDTKGAVGATLSHTRACEGLNSDANASQGRDWHLTRVTTRPSSSRQTRQYVSIYLCVMCTRDSAGFRFGRHGKPAKFAVSRFCEGLFCLPACLPACSALPSGFSYLSS